MDGHQLIEEILIKHQRQLDEDYLPYLNHCHRVYTYSLIFLLIRKSELLAVVAAHHDLDIWYCHSMDYLAGSSQLATRYIRESGTEINPDEVDEIIQSHHYIRKIKTNHFVEAFRKADLVDLTNGGVRCNLPGSIIRETNIIIPVLGLVKASPLKY